MSGEAEGSGFFSRWSQRKRAAREEGQASPPGAEAREPPAPEAVAPPAAEALAPRAEPGPAEGSAPAAPEPIEWPSLDSLTAETDFRLFLRDGVPEAIRHAALRRLWSLDPAIRDFTNALDYGWDFNAPDGGMAGFSNTLTGDIEKLLRQAIGLVEEAAEERPDSPEERAPEAPVLLAAPAPDFVPPAFAPPLPAPEPDPDPAPARRRHGGALPA
jgi:hypothetical protein